MRHEFCILISYIIMQYSFSTTSAIVIATAIAIAIFATGTAKANSTANAISISIVTAITAAIDIARRQWKEFRWGSRS